MTTSFRVAVAVTSLAVASVLAISGCAPGPVPASSPPPTEAGYGVVPEPGRTIRPTPGRFDEPLTGYRIVVVTAIDGEDAAASAVLRDAARRLEADRGAEVIESEPPTPDADGVASALETALETDPDLIVGLGASVVDVFSLESAQLLSQQFLVVGAQLPEPTSNVTSVIWDEAASRGSATAADGEVDAQRVTPEFAADALAIGVANVRAGVTGVVLSVAPGS